MRLRRSPNKSLTYNHVFNHDKICELCKARFLYCLYLESGILWWWSVRCLAGYLAASLAMQSPSQECPAPSAVITQSTFDIDRLKTFQKEDSGRKKMCSGFRKCLQQTNKIMYKHEWFKNYIIAIEERVNILVWQNN